MPILREKSPNTFMAVRHPKLIVQHNELGNQTIRLYHSHLAIEVYNFKFGEAPSIRKAEFRALYTP